MLRKARHALNTKTWCILSVLGVTYVWVTKKKPQRVILWWQPRHAFFREGWWKIPIVKKASPYLLRRRWSFFLRFLVELLTSMNTKLQS